LIAEPEIYEGLTEILQDTFMRDDLVATPELTARDIAGWDSLKQIDIILAAEERFGVKFGSKDIDGLASIGDLAALVARKAG
jgi:acyl carrier protein